VSAHDYLGVAVWISFLASVEQEIYHEFKFFTVFIYNFRFWAAILANWWVANLFWPYHLVALPYLGKVTKAFLLTPSGYEMAAERMAWGVIYPPPSTYEGKLKPNCLLHQREYCGWVLRRWQPCTHFLSWLQRHRRHFDNHGGKYSGPAVVPTTGVPHVGLLYP